MTVIRLLPCVDPIRRRPVPVGVVQPLDLLLGRVVQRAGAFGLGQLRGGDGWTCAAGSSCSTSEPYRLSAVGCSLRPIMPSATSAAPATQLKMTLGIVNAMTFSDDPSRNTFTTPERMNPAPAAIATHRRRRRTAGVPEAAVVTGLAGAPHRPRPPPARPPRHRCPPPSPPSPRPPPPARRPGPPAGPTPPPAGPLGRPRSRRRPGRHRRARPRRHRRARVRPCGRPTTTTRHPHRRRPRRAHRPVPTTAGAAPTPGPAARRHPRAPPRAGHDPAVGAHPARRPGHRPRPRHRRRPGGAHRDRGVRPAGVRPPAPRPARADARDPATTR